MSAQRAVRVIGQSGAAGTERFSRCADVPLPLSKRIRSSSVVEVGKTTAIRVQAKTFWLIDCVLRIVERPSQPSLDLVSWIQNDL
jgi:hypothetical protein